MSTGGVSRPSHMTDDEWEEYKRTAEYAHEVSHIPDSDFEPPDDDGKDEEGPATFTCGGCKTQFVVPPYEDPDKCPRGVLDDPEICPDCAELCEICHGEHRECKEIDVT